MREWTKVPNFSVWDYGAKNERVLARVYQYREAKYHAFILDENGHDARALAWFTLKAAQKWCEAEIDKIEKKGKEDNDSPE